MLNGFIFIVAGWAPFNNESNEKNHHYYAPEIQMVMEKYLSLQSDPSALEAFVKEQKAIASRMMQVCVNFLTNPGE